MKVRDFREMSSLLSSAGPGDCGLVCGPEPYQALRLERVAVTRFREGLGFEVVRMEGGSMSEGDVSRTLMESSMFSTGKLLLVREAHGMGKKPLEEVREAAASGLHGGGMLLFSPRKPGESAAVRKLSADMPAYICYEPFPRAMAGWARRLAEEEGVTLSGEAAHALGDYSGRSLVRMADALSRLSLYHGEGTRIDGAGVMEVLAGRDRPNVFQLGDALFGGSRGEALALLRALLRDGESPVAMNAYLFAQWSRGMRARDVLDAGGDKREVARATGSSYPMLERLMRTCRGPAWDRPLAAVRAFSRTDESLKSGGEPFTSLARLVFALTSSLA